MSGEAGDTYDKKQMKDAVGVRRFSSRDSMVREEETASAVKLAEARMRWVSLHHHSTYSFKDGYGHPREHIARAAELGMSAMALTEHGNVSSHPKLEQAARSAGVKPIFGVELYCGEGQVKRKNHLTVLAQSEAGYRNLLRMMTWAWTEGFYYEPTVNGRMFAELSSGLIVASGCLGSLLATSLIGGKNVEERDASYERGRDVARRFRDLLGDRYYLEVQAFDKLEATRKVNPMLEEIGRELGIPLVATADVHYCLPEHNHMQTLLHATRPGSSQTFEQQANSWGYDVLLSHPQSDREMWDRLRGTGLSRDAAKEAILSSGEIADRCEVELPKASPLRYPTRRDPRKLFYRQLRDGWEYRGIADRDDPEEYAARLRREVSVIEEKDFVDYFLIVGDMVRWTKDHGILVGPARGSAAASLVCYLLRITEVDPLNPLYGADLVFERFIDVTRIDLPDIDLDFDDERRIEVYEYLREKYGEDRVSIIGTFMTYKSKSCLDDVARVHEVPVWEVDTVKDLLIERSSGDLRASATIEDTVEMFSEAKEVFERYPALYDATKLEGMVKGMGRHAAGVVVSSTALTETCAVHGANISMDKYDAEYLNLLKIDNLGLSTVGMLAEAIDLLGWTIEDLYAIDLEDPATLKGFQDNDCVGVFQFDGRAVRLINGALAPDSFYEVCVVQALARPGPLHNGAADDYIDIKHGRKSSELTHPLFDEICANTYYQVVYQEQILRIVREIGGFDWTAAAYIRKIISRKLGDQEFNRQASKFIEGAGRNGVPEELAKAIWGLCITAGSYAFNAAHSVSYGMLAWWCMYVKQHHPQEFYVAGLRRLPEGDKGEKRLDLMRDAVRHGIRILPPHPAKSGVTWAAEGRRSIRAGFDTLPGVGPKLSVTIAEYAEETGLASWSDLLGVKGIGPKKLEPMLEYVAASDPLGIHLLDRTMARVVKQIESGELRRSDGSYMPMPTHRTLDIPRERGSDIEVVWIGTMKERNLRDLFEVNMRRSGVMLNPEEVRRPDLREWVLLRGTDGDDMLTVRVDRWRYPKFKKLVWSIALNKDIVLVKGVKRSYTPQRIVDATDLIVIDPEEDGGGGSGKVPLEEVMPA